MYELSQLQSLINNIHDMEENPQQVVDTVGNLLTDKKPLFWSYVGKLATALRFILMLPRPLQEFLMSFEDMRGGGVAPKAEVKAQIQKKSVYK